MYGRWGVGFTSAVVAVLVVFLHIISAAVYRRWNLSQVRREEVEHLARLAAEEAARTEEESTLAYVQASIERSGGGYGGGSCRYECAVCHRPTSTRCSRCKTVRYCSGTCQIIHWRQGHKDECHRPQVDHQGNPQESSSLLRNLQAEKSELLDNTSGNELKSLTNKLSLCFEGPSIRSNMPNNIVGHYDARIESTCVSLLDSSSSCFTYPDSFENYEASASEGLHPRHPSKMGEDVTRGIPSSGPQKAAYASCIENPRAGNGGASLSHGIPSSGPQKAVDASCIENPRVGIGGAGLPINNLSRTTNSKKKLSISSTKDESSLGLNLVSSNFGTTTTFSRCHSNHKNVGANAYCVDSSLKNSGQNRNLGASATDENSFVNSVNGTAKSNFMDCRVMTSDKLNFSLSGKSVHDWLLKARRSRSLSASLADSAFSGGRRHFVSDSSSSKVNNGPPFLNSTSDFRAYVKNVGYQLKPSLNFGDLSSMPINFSYKLFAELYKFDMVDMGPFGLVNCGNSCFANAVLQCLAFTRPLTAYLFQGFHSLKCSRRGWCFTCEFENLIVKGKQGQSPLSPAGILSHIDRIGSHFSQGREEDAHEFLRYAIDAMQYACIEENEEVAVNFLEDAGLIQLTFGGYLWSEIICLNCKAKSEQLERMMDLTVEIQGNIGTLERALKQFTTTEVLDGDNRYHCDRCKSFERAKKKLSVIEAPNVLTIALKRFQLGKFGKLNKSVRFPVHLDLAPYLSRADPCPLYNLYAVVVHVDALNATFSGHYICYVKNLKGQWYMIDDKEVMPVDVERVLKENAYMLFYARKAPHAPNLIKNERSQILSKPSSWFKKPPNFPHNSEESDHLIRTTRQTANSESFNFFGEKLYFPRTDSSSDNLSLSCSEEGSGSAESTRNSTSTDELSDYLFGGAPPPRWSQQSCLSDNSDQILHSPSTSGHHFNYEDYGHFLYSDRTIDSDVFMENCKGRESYWNRPCGERASVLMRSSTVNERRHQTLY